MDAMKREALESMKAAIGAYEKGGCGIDALTKDLEGFLETMDLEEGDRWKSAFLDEWGELQKISAVNFGGMMEKTPHAKQLIRTSLANIKALIAQYIAKDPEEEMI